MKNFIQKGNTLDLIAPATVTSGSPVVVGSIFGIAATDAASGDTVTVDIEGCFEIAKVVTDAIVPGDKLYWDSGAAKVTKVAGSGSKLLVGVAIAAAGNGVTTVRVRLMPTAQTGPA